MNYSLVALIVLLPLATFALLGLFGRRYFSKAAGAVGSGTLALSTALSIYTAYQYFFVDGKVNGVYRQIIPFNYTWLEFTPNLSINMGVIIDPVSMMMIVVVTFISLMVHVFSIGYMKGEERLPAYFAFLSLFTFSMLGLVLSANIFQIYIFWELVGVSSFLLIGFYYFKPAAVAASKKAFIVTRFADLGFLIGILILGFYAQTLDFSTLIERLTDTTSLQYAGIVGASFLGVSMLTWGLALVFIGGAGKSAMFPLHIWLPDAMEGPTPVSALIHAATMVVAGVYLVARLFPIYALSAPGVLEGIMYVGVFSAVFAAIIACTQTDIKRILAYSTMSQIGYMMFALGVARYGGEEGLGFIGSMFHLFTHAFFKSLLFLGAGAIIHAVHSNNLEQMGGLRKLLPVTHITFLLACLAIAGLPPFAGFFSKEEILLATYNHNKVVYAVALLTSGLTAFYMFRLYFSVFWNKPFTLENHNHQNTGTHMHPVQEGSWYMKLPMIVLALGSVGAGLVPFANFITTDGAPMNTHLSLTFSLLPIALAIAGIGAAAFLYKKENQKPRKMAASLGSLYKGAKRKFYVDEAYLFITQKVIVNLVAKPAAWIDKKVIDGTVNLAGSATMYISNSIRALQSGRVQVYTIFFFGGALAMAVLFIYFIK